ncbi:hypothetical protein PsYK624_170910 [Phanerochaete sordida]|uniref:Uncharacterized protein n=1 Tax=Phanerochaete sordida TaxID=48140 RepID=A0A9P3GYQ0_9APHY|nr:hypothetical protein PsYK624_170910 [Phanerochaete sordida]
MLFERITFRSADDVEQLLAFLDAPAFLGDTLKRHILSLHIIEDCASHNSIPWSQQVPLYLPRFSPNVSVSCTFEGLIPGSNDSAPLFRRSSLPRRLPMKTCKFRHVTLSGLRLPSVRGLADLVKEMLPTDLHLLDVAFADENPDLLPLEQSWPLRLPPLLRELHITRCFKGSAGLALWLQLSSLFFAGKGFAPLDVDVQTSVFNVLHLCVLLHGRQDSTSDLQVITLPLLQDSGQHTKGWEDRYTLTDIATIYTRTEEGIQPCINSALIICPQLDDAAMSVLDRLATLFTDTAHSGRYPTSIDLWTEGLASCKLLLTAILDARVFAAPSAFVLRRFRVSRPGTPGYTVAKILSAPRSIGEDELCVALTTAPRVDWVLRQDCSADVEYFDTRDEYLRELQDAAREAGMMGATDAGVARVG